MENYILIGVGILDLGVTSMLFFKNEFAENYVKTSPKGYIWRKIFGEQKAIKIIKYLAPIGIIFGFILIFLGLTL